jgi:hypothetical protein
MVSMTSKGIKQLLGPRIPIEDFNQDRLRYQMPNLLLGVAAILLLVSIFLPYWKLTLHAPQYPKGLAVQVYVNRLTGDVGEIDGLNHYIGMRPLAEAAQLERSLSIYMIIAVSLLVSGAIFIHNQFAALLTLPALLYPIVFLGDMYYWMRNFGLNLDPTAPLSSSIKPFIPPILGEGLIAQFRTVATLEIGMYTAIAAAILILIGLYFHRRAYKPLVEAFRAEEK